MGLRIMQARYTLRSSRRAAREFMARLAEAAVAGKSELARRAGLTRQTIGNLLDGVTLPSESTLRKLCDAHKTDRKRRRPEFWAGER